MASFSLAALTALELAPPALIDVAAACGYQHVGVRLLPATPGGIAYPLMDDKAGLRETLARCVTFFTVEKCVTWVRLPASAH